MLQENKARQNFPKTNISYPLIRTHTLFVCLFFRIFNVFCFLETPVLESLFCLITVENKILELVVNLFSLIKCIWKISPLLGGTLIKIWICGTWFLCPLLTCVCFLARNLPLQVSTSMRFTLLSTSLIHRFHHIHREHIW